MIENIQRKVSFCHSRRHDILSTILDKWNYAQKCKNFKYFAPNSHITLRGTGYSTSSLTANFLLLSKFYIFCADIFANMLQHYHKGEHIEKFCEKSVTFWHLPLSNGHKTLDSMLSDVSNDKSRSA